MALAPCTSILVFLHCVLLAPLAPLAAVCPDAGAERALFDVEHCAPLSAPFNLNLEPSPGCATKTGDFRSVALPFGDVLDATAEFRPRRGGPPIRIEPRPRTNVRIPSSRWPASVACDEVADRLYYANTAMGYLVAYDTTGRELWRAELPSFIRMDDDPGINPNDPSSVVAGLMRCSGVLSVSVTGALLAVQYRTGDGLFQTVYHRSGTRIGTLGPWDGALTQPVDGGWIIAYGGSESTGEWSRPVARAEIRVRNTDLELLTRHFVASLLPDPDEESFTVRSCASVGRAAMFKYLGKDFRPDFAAAAREARTILGPDWFREFFLTRVSPTQDISMKKGTTEEWYAKIERALLQAGADIDFARLLAQHPEWLQRKGPPAQPSKDDGAPEGRVTPVNR